MKSGLDVIIVGGGIGGLTTALALHRFGISARVFESVDQMSPLGVGINIQPNGVRELTELGLGDRLAETGIPTAELAYFNKHGQLIWKEPRGLASGYRWPQYSIHRGELQVLLYEAVRERLGADRVLSGHHLKSFEVDADGVTARFVSRATGAPAATVRGDALIGADGIHSAVRRAFYPDEGEPSRRRARGTRRVSRRGLCTELVGQSNVSTVRATSPAFIARKASLMSSSRPRRVTISSSSSRPWR